MDQIYGSHLNGKETVEFVVTIKLKSRNCREISAQLNQYIKLVENGLNQNFKIVERLAPS